MNRCTLLQLSFDKARGFTFYLQEWQVICFRLCSFSTPLFYLDLSNKSIHFWSPYTDGTVHLIVPQSIRWDLSKIAHSFVHFYLSDLNKPFYPLFGPRSTGLQTVPRVNKKPDSRRSFSLLCPILWNNISSDPDCLTCAYPFFFTWAFILTEFPLIAQQL